MLEEGAGVDVPRSRLPTRSITSAPILAPPAAFDSSAVRLHSPVARLADALPIMADVALRPTFPKDELERQRQERLTSLLQGARRSGRRFRRSPSRACSTARNTATACRTFGTAETIKTFTVDDLQRSTRRSSARTTPRSSSSATSPPTRSCRCSSRASAPGRRPAAAAGADAARRSISTPARADLSRRQTGRAAVADPHRLDRRPAIDAGLLPAARAEYGPRRSRSRRA